MGRDLARTLFILIALTGHGCVGTKVFSVLRENEIFFSHGRVGTRHFKTSTAELTLRYDERGIGSPTAVVYFYRQPRDGHWIPGPRWIPGSPHPAWSPPWFGRWELRAVPEVQHLSQPIPGAGPAHVVIFFDRDSPGVWPTTRSTSPDATRVPPDAAPPRFGPPDRRARPPSLGPRPNPPASPPPSTRDAGETGVAEPPAEPPEHPAGRPPVPPKPPPLEVHPARPTRPDVQESTAPFVIFRSPPATQANEISVEYDLRNPYDYFRVELWVRETPHGNWTLASDVEAGDEIQLELPDGVYRMRLIGIEDLHHRGVPPPSADDGHGELLVDTTPPRLRLEGPADSRFQAREIISIRPTAEDRHLSPFPLSFRLSKDGGATFQTLQRYHPNGEWFRWRAPATPGTYVLEVTVQDLSGNVTRSTVSFEVRADGRDRDRRSK